MFPALEPALVQALCAEIETTQRTIDTLLVLSAAVAETTPQMDPHLVKDVGINDHDLFPVLVNSDGWQVAGKQASQINLKEHLGTDWLDRARAAAKIPQPQQLAKPLSVLRSTAWRKPGACRRESLVEQADGETDWELRERMGQRRARNIARDRRPPKLEMAPQHVLASPSCGEDVASE